MRRSTEPSPGHPATPADHEFAARTLRELLQLIEVGNANAAAHPRPGRCTFLVSHAWIDGANMHLVYTAPPSDRTWGLVRDTRQSLINPSPWHDTDDPAFYYYLIDLEEEWPGGASRGPGEPERIWWNGYPIDQTSLPHHAADIPATHRYTPPAVDPSWINDTPPVVVQPRRYADPNGPLPPEARRRFNETSEALPPDAADSLE